jgi:hypothetical protein
LRDGEAECYENVIVHYIPGAKAVLTIYTTTTRSDHDGAVALEEQVSLEEHAGTKESLHRLLRDRGFVLRPPDEQRRILDAASEQQRQERATKSRHTEYYRIREHYTEAFRKDVSLDYDQWMRRPKQSRFGAEKNTVAANYDKINLQNTAVWNQELIRSANAYLDLMLQRNGKAAS